MTENRKHHLAMIITIGLFLALGIVLAVGLDGFLETVRSPRNKAQMLYILGAILVSGIFVFGTFSRIYRVVLGILGYDLLGRIQGLLKR